MKVFKSCALIIGLFLPIIASARINETLEQCKERYGEDGWPGKDGISYGFNKNDLFISIIFDKNKKVECISFSKPGSGVVITKEEIEELLKLNSGGSSWIEIDPNTEKGYLREWKTKDNSLCASLKKSRSGILYIKTKAYEDRERAKAVKSLDGF